MTQAARRNHDHCPVPCGLEGRSKVGDTFERLVRVDAATPDPDVRVLRVGSKVPAFDPDRIDSEVLDCFEPFQTVGRSVYFMVHFNHS